MRHGSCRNQRAEQIRRMGGNHEKTPDQKEKQQNHKDSPHKSELLTDDGKNHVVLCLRHEAELLDTTAKPFPEQAAGANGKESLERLVPFLIFLRILPDGDTLQTVTLQSKKDSHESNPCHRHPYELGIFRTGGKDQDHGNAKNNHRRA